MLVDYPDDDDDTTTTSSSSSSSSDTINNNNNNKHNIIDIKKKFSIDIAPDVVPDYSVVNRFEKPNSTHLIYNPRYDVIYTPVAGPTLPHQKQSLDSVPLNCPTGYLEDHNINHFAFDSQYYSFNNKGTAYDPDASSSDHLVGVPKETKRKKRRRPENADDLQEGYHTPWTIPASEKEEQEKRKKEIEKINREQKEKEEKEEDDDKEDETSETKEQKLNKRREAREEQCSTILHTKEEHDYLGRTYIDPPPYLKPGITQTYLPKKRIHTWMGHTKGVAAIRFFPNYGHLLLSAGLDSQVKIWDVYNDRKCLRTFIGHQKAVRDICFTPDGKNFLSCGYDRQIFMWDTETGKCMGNFSNGKIPYCIKYNPSKVNEFLAGCSDKKIIQWDTRSKNIVQEYDQHLGAVNTVTFIDDNRRFVTSSDDKSLRIWEYGIPVVIKYISEPHMHSMPSIAVHPNENWFAAQSLDNQILIYGSKDRFKLNKKKRFLGHLVSGFACQVNFSPDGRYVISGDGEGKLWFWDWTTSKVLKTIKCHTSVCIGCEWHPIETSKVATCGWDGSIHYWD